MVAIRSRGGKVRSQPQRLAYNERRRLGGIAHRQRHFRRRRGSHPRLKTRISRHARHCGLALASANLALNRPSPNP
jgi:hypothetical protein